MYRVSVFFLLSLSLLSGLAQAHGLDEYSLKFWSYPRNNLGCTGTAEAFAKNFTTTTGITRVIGRCGSTNPNDGSYEIDLVYIAEAPVKKVQTFDGMSTGGQGVYSGSDLSPALLKQEMDQFTAATGLPVFAAYFTTALGLGGPGVFAQIIGFGEPKSLPQVYTEETISSLAPELFPSIVATLEAQIRARGVDLVKVALGSMGSLGTRLTIRYYSATGVSFSFAHDVFFSSLDSCLWGASDIAQQLQSAKNPPLAVFCSMGKNYSGGGTVMWVTMTGDTVFYTRQTKRVFSTLIECVRQRPSVLAEYQTLETGKGAFAAYCSPSSQGYLVSLFLEF